MLHVFLPAPFPDAARQRLFEAVWATLDTPATPPTLLAGQVPLPNGAVADAVVVRPHSLTVLLLHPGGGLLSIPDFAGAPWLLNGQPLPDNPFQQFQQLQPALLQLLGPWLPPDAVNPRFVTGLWLAAEPVRFAADVEVSMSTAPEARQLQLVADLGRLPRRLAQLATPEIDLTAADISQLADGLQAATAVAPSASLLPTEPTADAPTLGTVMQNTARQLWRWLGAEDVDELPPDTYALAARGEDRKHELEAQQVELQQQLAEQLRAIEAREAAREHSIAQLRAELAQAQQQAAPNTAELQARLAAENRAHEAEESRRQTSQAEWQRRNQDLDAKINALEQLIQRLQTAPAPAQSTAASIPDSVAATVVAPKVAAAPTPTTQAPPSATASSPAAPRPAGASPLPERLRAWLSRLPLREWGQKLRRRGLATDHWLAMVGLAVLGFGAMIWLGTQGFTRVPPEPYQANGRWGFSKHDKPVIEAKYSSVQPFQEDRAVVEQDGAFGAVNPEGEEVVPPTYDALNSYAEGYARVRIGQLYTFIDQNGEEFSHYFYNAYDFSEGYAPVLDRRGWFYISGPDAGVPEHPRLFQEAYPFHDGLARVRKNGTYTFIDRDYLTDTTRHDTAPFGRYEQATDFTDGKARVRQHGRSFYIDKDAEEVKP
ncbi:WG repeat-containing protein [Hymenobacter sp. CRA2]|uniref:WG repeat-containing protein n=1 Tax=Hymenobacter sp. CRA2 TaxID=1955620 RepID=UPI00098EABBE|nr:WG repeat-containing protein [Hymenobacter sp. CRA2]OON68359.1 hypothetical protein B0919_14525 [Hymenobacter sp. CRA2]